MHLFSLLFLTSGPLAQAVPAPAAPTQAAAPAQTPGPRLSRIPVGTCGCALYAPGGMSFDPPTKSDDGADVWTGEAASGAWTFGAVVVRFGATMPTTDGAGLEDLLVQYLEFLKGQAGIVGAVGVGRGQIHAENAAARGVIDFWKDKDGASWAVKGWVDAHRLAVLYVRGQGDYPYFNAQELYLDGFRFVE